MGGAELGINYSAPIIYWLGLFNMDYPILKVRTNMKNVHAFALA